MHDQDQEKSLSDEDVVQLNHILWQEEHADDLRDMDKLADDMRKLGEDMREKGYQTEEVEYAGKNLAEVAQALRQTEDVGLQQKLLQEFSEAQIAEGRTQEELTENLQMLKDMLQTTFKQHQKEISDLDALSDIEEGISRRQEDDIREVIELKKYVEGLSSSQFAEQTFKRLLSAAELKLDSFDPDQEVIELQFLLSELHTENGLNSRLPAVENSLNSLISNKRLLPNTPQTRKDILDLSKILERLYNFHDKKSYDEWVIKTMLVRARAKPESIGTGLEIIELRKLIEEMQSGRFNAVRESLEYLINMKIGKMDDKQTHDDVSDLQFMLQRLNEHDQQVDQPHAL